MPDEQKLLPCPFCGSGAVRCDHNDYAWFAECEKCGANQPADPDLSEVRRAWNTRTSLPGVVTLWAEEAGRVREAMLGARIYLCKCGCPTCDRCTAWKAINEALGIITRAQKEG